MPVFPAVASTIVPPGASFPSCSARRMIPMAARSFTLPPGFRYSSLANTSADPAGTRRFNCNIAVSPTSWVMSSATRRRETSEVFERTLQVKGRRWNRQSGRGLGGLGFVNLEHPRYHLGNGLRDRGEANHGAARPFVINQASVDSGWARPCYPHSGELDLRL